MLNRLNNDFPQHVAIPEGHFLMGECYLQLGYYAFAVSEFETLLGLIPEPAQIDRQVNQASGDIIADKQLSADLMNRSESMQASLATMLFSEKPSNYDLASFPQERNEIIRKIQVIQQEMQTVADR